MHLTQISPVALITESNQIVTQDIELSFQALVKKRQSGVPVAYLTGLKEFWSLEFIVTPDTLIPRPETELLVESALALMDEKKQVRVLDLGTGTGAVAISIAASCLTVDVIATDVCRAALAIAVQNAQKHQVTNISFCYSDWFGQLDAQQFDLIVSNPPYICELDPHLQSEDIKHEPISALVAGNDGLDDLRILISQAPNFLSHEGWLLTEHGYDQKDAVARLFETSGFKNIRAVNDLNQIPRVTLGQCVRTN